MGVGEEVLRRRHCRDALVARLASELLAQLREKCARLHDRHGREAVGHHAAALLVDVGARAQQIHHLSLLPCTRRRPCRRPHARSPRTTRSAQHSMHISSSEKLERTWREGLAAREQRAQNLIERLQQQVQLARAAAALLAHALHAAQQQRQVLLQVADGDAAERERRGGLDLVRRARQRRHDAPLGVGVRREVGDAAQLAQQQQR